VLVTVGLYLVPFAGIAFPLFMMAFKALPDCPADLAQTLQLASWPPLSACWSRGPRRPAQRC
jgi:hypothetical protein